MMDLETFAWLLTDAGRELIAVAEAGDLSDAAQLSEISRLRRLASPIQAAAAYETALLRRRALPKFPDAERMFFVREALEQASGITTARHRAKRYAQLDAGLIADLCCGIGGDTLALARVARVVAVDNDPLRLAIARANATALSCASQIEYLELDLETMAPPQADAIFFDPARRSAGRRVFELAKYQPPITLIDTWRQHTPAIGVKLAPGVADEDLVGFGAFELEFISVGYELKEAVLWLGALGQAGKRATVIDRHDATHTLFLPTGQAQPIVPLQEPGKVLYEPDSAVIRAGLVQMLAGQLGVAQIDREIAYLTSDQVIETPFARSWRVIEWMPFNLKRIQARLRELDAGSVTVKKRGSPLDTDLLARKLSGTGSHALVVALTFVLGKPAALICESMPITNWPLGHEVMST